LRAVGIDPAVWFGEMPALSLPFPCIPCGDEARAREAFERDYPAYATTAKLDELRARDYARLDGQGHVYLDFTGAGLPAASHVRAHLALLTDGIFGNPHSGNPASEAAGARVAEARAAVLAYLGAPPEEYEVIFTANATGALKLVGESYPFARGGACLLTSDNHNSVNGIREFARAAGAAVRYAPLCPPELRVDAAELAAAWAEAQPGAHNLFAYPAQSNFSGVQHPLTWIEQAQAHGWDVLLDASAFAPTNRLDLRRLRPDFVALSFYKMFGYPTGTGCLLARKRALGKLRRPWFAGGTIAFSSVAGDGHYLLPDAAGFEDGTVNFLALPAVTMGLERLASIGIETIHTRVMCLTAWLLDRLRQIRHANGRPAVRIYGPADGAGRGATIAFNLFDRDGDMWGCGEVERAAAARAVSLRAGCHCNPGAREAALGFTARELRRCFRDAPTQTLDDYTRAIAGKTAGVVRASLGPITTFHDLFQLASFLESFVDAGPAGA
jgi:selenocysteine lyase/cysteine desulfurase